ncbi:MAG: hypothetical protein AB7I68_13615 [Porticoccaceae bacterium]
MSTQAILLGIFGVISGYVFLPLVAGGSSIFVTMHVNLWAKGRHKPGKLSKSLATVVSAIFIIFAFFAIASTWIDLLITNTESDAGMVAKAWQKGWFIGIVLFMLTPWIGKLVGRHRSLP